VAFHTRGQDFLNQLPEIQKDLPVSPFMTMAGKEMPTSVTA